MKQVYYPMTEGWPARLRSEVEAMIDGIRSFHPSWDPAEIERAQSARGRDDIRIIRLPSSVSSGVPNQGMLQVPDGAGMPERTFSTSPTLNPEMKTTPLGLNYWDHGGFYLSTVGIDTVKGEPCHRDACGPRALANATGGEIPYGVAYYDGREKGWLEQRDWSQGGIPVTVLLQSYPGGARESRRFVNPDESLFDVEQQTPEQLQEAFGAMEGNSGILVAMRKKNQYGGVGGVPHGMGYYHGKQVRSWLTEEYTPDNTLAVTELHILP